MVLIIKTFFFLIFTKYVIYLYQMGYFKTFNHFKCSCPYSEQMQTYWIY